MVIYHHKLTFECDALSSDRLREMKEWCQVFACGASRLLLHSATGEHFWLFRVKDDAVLFKLTYGGTYQYFDEPIMIAFSNRLIWTTDYAIF